MEQYNTETDTPITPHKVSDESKKIHALDELVKMMQEKINAQQQEIVKQSRDINRIKNDIDLLTNALRNRG